MFKALRQIMKDQRGITGLETAIILIAFVVVASVFAYTVLSAGIFSSEKGKEAINSGLEVARSSLELSGGVIAASGDDTNVDSVVYVVANSLDGEAIDLSATTDADNDGIISDEGTKNHVVIISYVDSTQRVADIAWTATQMGKGDSDDQLDPGEKFQISVDLQHLSTRLQAYGKFTLEMKPAKGSSLTIERTIPAVVDTVMDLK